VAILYCKQRCQAARSVTPRPVIPDVVPNAYASEPSARAANWNVTEPLPRYDQAVPDDQSCHFQETVLCNMIMHKGTDLHTNLQKEIGTYFKNP